MNLSYLLPRNMRHFMPESVARFLLKRRWIIQPGLETRDPFALSGSLLATFGNMAFIYLAVYLLLLGIDHHVSFWLIAGLYSLTYFVTLFPVSINGLGMQELSKTLLLIQLGGLSSSESAAVALLTRVLFIVTSLPGAFFLPSILATINIKVITLG